jgi:hypothetical protein
MTINIELAPGEERKLEEKARARGQIVVDFVRDLIQKELDGGPGVEEPKEKSLAQILTPIWDGWRESGMSAEETEKFLEEELQNIRRERNERDDRS